MVESALPLQQALNMLVLKTEYNKPKGVHLQRYQLSANECWNVISTYVSYSSYDKYMYIMILQLPGLDIG